jgi:hypothetical protein
MKWCDKTLGTCAIKHYRFVKHQKYIDYTGPTLCLSKPVEINDNIKLFFNDT